MIKKLIKNIKDYFKKWSIKRRTVDAYILPLIGNYENYHTMVDEYIERSKHIGVAFVYDLGNLTDLDNIDNLKYICASVKFDTIQRIGDSDKYKCQIVLLKTPKGKVLYNIKKYFKSNISFNIKFNGYIKDDRVVKLTSLRLHDTSKHETEK